MRYLETDTGTNVDISSATAIGAYTANADRLIICDVSLDAVAGAGDYVMYITRQIGGAGSAYVILPKSTLTAATGETAISGQSGFITVRNGDVLTCYVDGLAGDTSTPDWTTRWYELAALKPATADRTIVVDANGLVTLAPDSITASVFDESTAFPIKSADTGATSLARTGADSDTLETLSDQMDAIDGKTTNLPADPADQSAVEAAIAAIPAGISVNDILGMQVEGTYTLQQILRIMSSALAGKLSGGGTATLKFRDLQDSLDRITATVDQATGDRDAITLDVS